VSDFVHSAPRDRRIQAEVGYRVYTDAALARLAFVRAAQAVGLTLGEIREVVAFRDRGETPCAHVVALVERREAELVERIGEMQRLHVEPEALVERARTLDPHDCSQDDVCRIITRRPWWRLGWERHHIEAMVLGLAIADHRAHRMTGSSGKCIDLARAVLRLPAARLSLNPAIGRGCGA
jgi:DNA-binding transcriptional MerR regulator